MKRFLKVFKVEQTLGFRSPDVLIFGMAMPVGILALIAVIAGGKTAGAGGYTYLQSAFASLIVVGVCASAFMGLPLTVADYRDKKILKHFFVTPCSPGLLLCVLVACCIVMAVLSAGAVVLVSVLGLGYRMPGDPLAFAGAYLLVLLSMFSVGMLMSSLARTVKMSNALCSLVYFPMLFLSGATIPFELFPPGLQKAASVLPLTQGIKLLKSVSLGLPVGNVGGIIFFLAVLAIVCVVISVMTFRWE